MRKLVLVVGLVVVGFACVKQSQARYPDKPAGTCDADGANACASGFVCHYNPDAACGESGVGACFPMPSACTKDYSPVCGCDGKTYLNICVGHSHGVSPRHAGECGQPASAGTGRVSSAAGGTSTRGTADRTAAVAAALAAAAQGMAQSMGAQSSSTNALLLFADDGKNTFLGCLNCGNHESSSVLNEYGPYGSKHAMNGVRNRYSQYGSPYSNYSACNPHATRPPKIVDNSGGYYGRFTKNRYAQGAAKSDYILRLLAVVCAD